MGVRMGLREMPQDRVRAGQRKTRMLRQSSERDQKPNNEANNPTKMTTLTNCPHSHPCHCGTAVETPHESGEKGCSRKFETKPLIEFANDRWFIHGHLITGFTLRSQRGYEQYPCGCWTHWDDSINSINA